MFRQRKGDPNRSSANGGEHLAILVYIKPSLNNVNTAICNHQPRNDLYFLLGKPQKTIYGCLKEEEPEITGSEARQKVVMRQGIETPLAKDLVKQIKSSKLKVQASIQGEKLRVSGKKRDDLQAVISLLKEADSDMPLQYENFRD